MINTKYSRAFKAINLVPLEFWEYIHGQDYDIHPFFRIQRNGAVAYLHKDGTIEIESADRKSIYTHFGWLFFQCRLGVRLYKDAYNAVLPRTNEEDLLLRINGTRTVTKENDPTKLMVTRINASVTCARSGCGHHAMKHNSGLDGCGMPDCHCMKYVPPVERFICKKYDGTNAPCSCGHLEAAHIYGKYCSDCDLGTRPVSAHI
jgi:hypothetical protein